MRQAGQSFNKGAIMQNHETFAWFQPGKGIFNALCIHELCLRNGIISVDLASVPAPDDRQKADMRLAEMRIRSEEHTSELQSH